MIILKHLSFDEERALYMSDGITAESCTFAGKADGESAFKESKNITIKDCLFELRYPFWHNKSLKIADSTMTETCRAALWYTENAELSDCTLGGVKALRECSNITLNDCEINSTEFGWKCQNIEINGGALTSEYAFFSSENIKINSLNFTGKYSFQYCNNAELHNCDMRTKDAFWHSKDITVYDSVINGEYLGWYSENLTLISCKIVGTQPSCYAKNLVLKNCTTEKCDLAFEYSSVDAQISGNIVSVKNPRSGRITADSIENIIIDENSRAGSLCEIITEINN